MIAIRLLASGRALRESVFRDAPLRIGRSPDNDFVIVDPSVSRAHVRLSRDGAGGLWLEDLDSRNGVHVGPNRVAKAAVPPHGVIRCRLGAVEIEVALDSSSDTLELRRPPAPRAGGMAAALATLGYWAGGIAACVVFLVTQPSFWSPWEDNRSTQLTWAAVTAGIGLPIAAFLLLGLLRIAHRRLPYADALRALCLVCWGWPVLWLITLLSFYVLAPGAHGILGALVKSIGVIATIAYLAGLARPRRRLVFFFGWSVAVGVFVVAIAAAGRLAARQAGTPQVDYEVMVPLFGVTGPASPLATHLDQVRSGFATAAAEAEQEFRRTKARAGP